MLSRAGSSGTKGKRSTARIRPMSSKLGWWENSTLRKRVSGRPDATAALLKVGVRTRSSLNLATSTSATAIWLLVGKRAVCASSAPSSWIVACPSQARSVVLSPGPAAE